MCYWIDPLGTCTVTLETSNNYLSNVFDHSDHLKQPSDFSGQVAYCYSSARLISERNNLAFLIRYLWTQRLYAHHAIMECAYHAASATVIPLMSSLYAILAPLSLAM